MNRFVKYFTYKHTAALKLNSFSILNDFSFVLIAMCFLFIRICYRIKGNYRNATNMLISCLELIRNKVLIGNKLTLSTFSCRIRASGRTILVSASHTLPSCFHPGGGEGRGRSTLTHLPCDMLLLTFHRK